MDPLTLTASLISITAAVTSCKQLVQKLTSSQRRPPALLLQISNELNDMQLILQSATALMADQKYAFEHTSMMRTIVGQLQATINQMEELVKTANKLQGHRLRGPDPKLYSQLKSLQQSLRTSRQVLLAWLSMVSSSSLSDKITLSIEAIESLLDKRSEDTSLQHPSDPQWLEHTEAYRLPAADWGFASDATACDDGCQCRCHDIRTFQTSLALRPIFGTASIGLSGSKISSCNRSPCSGREHYSIHIMYIFPFWLLQRAIYLEMASQGYGSVGRLGVYSLTSSSSAAFQCARVGDVAGLRSLFAQGLDAAHQIDEKGETLLMVALRYGHVDICRLLLQYGHDPQFSRPRGGSLVDQVLDQLLTTDISASNKTAELVHLFRNYAGFDSLLLKRGVSALHQAVSGLTTPLVSNDRRLSTDLDRLDKHERSALYYAVRRFDHESAQLLLAAGASPHVGRSAIPWTCHGDQGDRRTLRLLLAYGADPNTSDRNDYTALHACGIFGHGEDFVTTLTQHGAFLDQRYHGEVPNCDGMTALGFSALHGHLATMRSLLEHGASMDADGFGRTPLHLVISGTGRKTDRLLMVQLLLDHGVDFRQRDRKNKSAAEYAVDFCDDSALSLLTQAGLEDARQDSSMLLSSAPSTYKALTSALINGWPDVFTYILHGANLREIDSATGRTALHAVAQHGDTHHLYFLQQKIQQESINISSLRTSDLNGFRPEDLANESMRLHINKLCEGAILPPVQSVAEDEEAIFFDTVESFETTESWSDTAANNTGAMSLTWTHDGVAPEVSGVSGILSADTNQEIHIDPGQIEDGSIALPPIHDTECATWLSATAVDDVGHPVAAKGTPIQGLSTDAAQQLNVAELRTLQAIPLKPLDDFNTIGHRNLQDEDEGFDEHIEDISPYLISMNWQDQNIFRKVRTDDDVDSAYGSLDPNLDEMDVGTLVPIEPDKPVYTGSFYLAGAFEPIIHVLLLVLVWFSGIRSWVHRKLRPRLKPGHKRLIWRCACNTELYGDFLDSPALDGLAASLQASIEVSPSQNAAPTPVAAITLPSPVHAAGATHRGLQSHELQRGQRAIPLVAVANPQNPSSEIRRFVELCINTGKGSRSLGEIEVTHVRSDYDFFAWAKKKYKDVRGFRVKANYLVKPVAIRFVRFGLASRKSVHIFNEPSYPSKEALNDETWHYDPCPPDPPPPIPSETFIHYLNDCSELKDNSRGNPLIWLSRLPKKLRESLLETPEDLAFAWGIHIIEGPDYANILWTCIWILALALGPVVAYVVVKHDVQGATGIGGMLIGVLTMLTMIMKVHQHSDS